MLEEIILLVSGFRYERFSYLHACTKTRVCLVQPRSLFFFSEKDENLKTKLTGEVENFGIHQSLNCTSTANIN